TYGPQTGSSNTFTVNPASLNHFTFSLDSPQTNGAAFTGSDTLTAYDELSSEERRVGDYCGTVNVSSNKDCSNGCTTSDTFTGGVLASHSLTLTQTGSDAALYVIYTYGPQTGSSNTFTVDPASLNHFTFSLDSPQTNGVAFTGSDTLTAYDEF